MRTVIIDRSTGKEVARCRDLESAMLTAIRRNVANSDMLFVRGSVDIRIHDIAVKWQGQYAWLTEFLKEKSAETYVIKRAEDRLEIWERIRASREVAKASDIAVPMATAIGAGLAADLERLIMLSSHEQCRVFGPDIRRTWAEAFKSGSWLARRYPLQRFVLAVHEEFGAIIAVSYDLVRNYPAFIVRNTFTARKGV